MKIFLVTSTIKKTLKKIQSCSFSWLHKLCWMPRWQFRKKLTFHSFFISVLVNTSVFFNAPLISQVQMSLVNLILTCYYWVQLCKHYKNSLPLPPKTTWLHLWTADKGYYNNNGSLQFSVCVCVCVCVCACVFNYVPLGLVFNTW